VKFLPCAYVLGCNTVLDADRKIRWKTKPSNAEQALPPEQAAAKTAILAECDRLAEAGITLVAVHFDGSGDEGVNEDIKCYTTEDYAFEESEVQGVNFSYLQEHFEALVSYGYKNGCGGFGDEILNVKTRTSRLNATVISKTAQPRAKRRSHWPTHLDMRRATPGHLAASLRTILPFTIG
jgi:hypothetical protein